MSGYLSLARLTGRAIELDECVDSSSYSAPKYAWEWSRLWERPEGTWDMAGIDVHRSLGLSKVRIRIYFNRGYGH